MRGYLPTLVGDADPQRSRHRRRARLHAAGSTIGPERKRDYLRGFGAQFWNTGASACGAHGGSELIPGFGASLKKEIKRRHPAWFEIHPYRRGPALRAQPHHRRSRRSRIDTACRCSKIDYTIGENERKMTEHMADTIEEIVKAAGGELVDYTRGAARRNGSAIHEHGTCRMGADPKRSALNGFNQMHEVKNVFVVDGSCVHDRDRRRTRR